MSRLIWIYVVCKSILLSPVAVKELNDISSFFFIFWSLVVADSVPGSLKICMMVTDEA